MTQELSRRVFVATTAGFALALPVVGCSKKELKCDDVSGLSAEDKQQREAVKYVDKSTLADKVCEGCLQYEAGGEDKCGSCKVVKGPIHPKGYCTLWVKKA